MPDAVVQDVANDEVDRVRPAMVQWRRWLHAHPELSFDEWRTARFIERVLVEAGLRPWRPTPTSVVADLDGGQPGPCYALRADIDALPITEQTGLSFASEFPGRMHACGHDGHAAMLLATAHVLAGSAQRLSGRVRFIFQHAEEQIPGGAPQLVEAGVLEGVDGILGTHLWAPLQVGTIGVAAGPTMASADFFTVVVQGRGGHAGMPHDAIDPLPAAAQIVTSLQHLVARQTDPLDSLVVSVTRMQAGEANNIISDTAEVHGTVRAFSRHVRATAPERIERVARGVASAYGVSARCDYRFGPPPVDNDAELVAVVRRAAERTLGPQRLAAVRPVMGGDDFSFYQQRIPGAYFFTGAGGLGATPHHHPEFDIDERALPCGVRVLVESTRQLLRQRPDA